jgi:DNA-binding NarL/FixJ family response regulator
MDFLSRSYCVVGLNYQDDAVGRLEVLCMSGVEPQRIRILLVDDHTSLHAELCGLLADQGSMKVIGAARNPAEAVALAVSEQPDVILLDLDLHDNDSLELLPELCRVGHHARVIALTDARDAELHFCAIQAGAVGLVLKEQAPAVLAKAVEKVFAGEAWLERTLMAAVLTRTFPGKTPVVQAKPDGLAKLTHRERDIVMLVAQGLKRKQIAAHLFINETTVRNHLTSILSKLGVANQFELALYAYRHGLAQPPSA